MSSVKINNMDNISLDMEQDTKIFLKNNKIVCTIHHIDESKFDEKAQSEFYKRDKYIDLYHVISDKTLTQVKEIIKSR